GPERDRDHDQEREQDQRDERDEKGVRRDLLPQQRARVFDDHRYPLPRASAARRKAKKLAYAITPTRMKMSVEMAPARPKLWPESTKLMRKVNDPRMSVWPAGMSVPGMSGCPRVSSRMSTMLLKLKAKLEISRGTKG